MRLVKIPIGQLRPGMFVAEIDRPWLETPFALQGFLVRDYEDVHYIARYVNHVTVDIDYGGSQHFMLEPPPPPKKPPTVFNRLQLREDFQEAKLQFETAHQSLDRVFDSIKNGMPTDVGTVRKAVNPLIDSVFRNKDAVAALVRLKKTSEYRYEHSISMSVWAAILGRHIGLLRDELEKLVIGCAMCDVGMTKLPESLLSSAEPLTDKQRENIQQHPITGSEMVTHSGGTDFEILAIIENHHERHNGSGYPRGLEGAAIPLLARIAGLVDTYDAMLTPKSYAPSRSSFEAAQELMNTSGELFQESLVEQFVQAIGLYPTGALVELNTGEVAIVVKQNDNRRLKPELVVVLDKDKSPLPTLKLLDLGQTPLVGPESCWISKELKPGSYGVNSEEFFV